MYIDGFDPYWDRQDRSDDRQRRTRLRSRDLRKALRNWKAARA